MLPSFPKIWYVGATEVRDNLFKGFVEITEKIDGSQIGFGMNTEHELNIRSKGAPIVAKGVRCRAVDKLFLAAVEHIENLHADGKLKRNTSYYGEVVCGNKHNTLTYGTVPRNHIVLYGIQTDGYWLDDHEILVAEADRLGLDAVPLLYAGTVVALDDIKELLNRESHYGGCKIEGFVVKNYHQSANSAFSSSCYGKYVSDSFKEANGAEWNSKTNKVEDFFNSFTDEKRWEKVVQHLRDDGKLFNAPKDIGTIIPALLNDMETECSAAIKEQLYKLYIRQIKAYATKGFPEWYKKKLLEKVVVHAETQVPA